MRVPARRAGRSADSTTPARPAPVRALALLFVALVAAGPDAQFGTTVNVVEVYASVTDGRGEPVQGLGRGRFVVLEDGERQVIDTFVEGDFPLSVAIAVDRSLSMRGERLAAARAGARALLEQLRPADQAMVIAISGQVEVVAALSTDRQAALAAVDRLDAWSTTALHDAVLTALDRVQAGTGRRALVLLSDGDDRYSDASAEDVLARARESDVLVYPIALGRERPRLFAQIAAATGGTSIHAPNRTVVDNAVQRIARELRHQYLLGYTPVRPLTEGRGEWRSIRVEVEAPGVRVRAREGYVND